MNLLGEIFPLPKEHALVFGTLLAQGFIAAVVVSILFCYPLAFFYQKTAAALALIISLPTLILRLPELMAFGRNPAAIAISVYEIFSYPILLIAGAALAHRHLSLPEIATKQKTQQTTHRLP
ncbi:hypothetical protein [Jeongeupia sp. HS-3]|uniref:hypothetical protein n=1 Tax=Jeongeupia sp. HS-3 TaxID=1009682 RepID=UPI00191087F0|nr:hypothetical protein [Jeongeupia sp. HS-3]